MTNPIKPKLSPTTCAKRLTPICPYCGCKNAAAVGYISNRRSAPNLSLTCICCKVPFKFDKEVEVTYTSRPLEGWPTNQ